MPYRRISPLIMGADILEGATDVRNEPEIDVNNDPKPYLLLNMFPHRNKGK